MVKIGGLWLKDGEKGRYMTGSLNETSQLFVYKNDYKESDNHPDYIVYIAERKKAPKASSKKPQEDPLG